MNVNYGKYISDVDEIVEEARNGRMFILVDDEDRENEGDLIVPAQMATPDAINFMATHGRGLVCLALTPERVEVLGLSLMTKRNQSRLETAFTISIEARDGVTTGISAHDRAHTIAVAIDPTKSSEDIVTPGHVFPLVSRSGGVLVRAGHTEAAVDIARLAGLNPSSVICEVMNEDGTMARMPDLVQFAQRHGFKLGTIASLIEYRRRHDRIVERTVSTTFESRFGGAFNTYVFVNRVAYAEHLALVKGDITTGEPVLVRMHALSVFRDVLGDMEEGRVGELRKSMEMIGEEGRGVVVLIRESWATSLSDRVRERSASAIKAPEGATPAPIRLRDYGVGAQILLDLGVRDMILLTNTNRVVIGLEGYGLRIVDRRPIPDTEE
ncbi:MAG: 3,4-dihydroxy-2-butanone-4-phosphate synthase [Alphaproteobacteria bacterium]|nr:3,4-dihydroxy-2-butanone-4-phosphate synthase [Alphaproteobacteria bacterium]